MFGTFKIYMGVILSQYLKYYPTRESVGEEFFMMSVSNLCCCQDCYCAKEQFAVIAKNPPCKNPLYNIILTTVQFVVVDQFEELDRHQLGFQLDSLTVYNWIGGQEMLVLMLFSSSHCFLYIHKKIFKSQLLSMKPTLHCT